MDKFNESRFQRILRHSRFHFKLSLLLFFLLETLVIYGYLFCQVYEVVFIKFNYTFLRRIQHRGLEGIRRGSSSFRIENITPKSETFVSKV